MNARHRKQFSHKIVTGSATLYRYLIDKYHQSRKIVRQDLISCIVREGRLLTFNALELVDGMPARDKALVNLYHIQKWSVVAGIIEHGHCGGKKKNYGFCPAAIAYIDEMCDKLIADISAYDQSRKSQ